MERDIEQSARRIVIIGAGPGGICMGIKLLEAGYKNFVILEQAAGLGGTWWHNRYPGAACDVPSHLYSFSFEIKRDWSTPYAEAPEILAYMQLCADKYAVTAHVRLNTEVTSATWDEVAEHWQVISAGGATYTADVLVAAQGMFNELVWPDIAGLSQFAGTQFHTARWHHDHDLQGRRVAVIGSAASAVQCVPEIAKQAAELVMFQRTPNWVMPKKDRPYSREKLAYFMSTPAAVEHNRARLWEQFEGFVLLDDAERYASSVNMVLENIAVVDDPQLRDKLTPRYAFGCKRVLLSSKYYQAFNRANVHLVTDSIERITPAGVVTADGKERPFDTLIIATGFNVTRYLSSIEVVGRDARALNVAWQDGAQAYLGIATAGFPNLFQLYGPNTNKGSILFMLECQAAYIVRQIDRLDNEQLAWIDVRTDVMDEYNRGIQTDANGIGVWAEDCNNYFRHASGRVVTQYPRNMGRYHVDTQAPDQHAYSTARLTTPAYFNVQRAPRHASIADNGQTAHASASEA